MNSLSTFQRGSHHYAWLSAGCCLLFVTVLSGCSSVFGPASEPTATPTRVYAVVPTFTPTPATVAAAPTSTPTANPPTPTATVATPITATVAVTTTVAVTANQIITPTAAPANEAQLTIAGETVNVRSGPATTFDAIGSAANGESFPIVARNTQGDWWQICCINDQPGWVFGELATVANADNVAIAADAPTLAPVAVAVAPTPVPAADQPTPTSAPAAPAPPPVDSGSAGDFNPDAQYQIVHFKVLGLDENNGGIRDSRAQHHIFLTVLDQSGNGVNGAVVENLVGEKGQIVTGDKGPGKAEITMYYEPFKFRVVADGSGPVTSQVSNQMGLAFPHLPDIVGKLGGLDYEYAVCPTLEVKCQWPIQAVHFSYEIIFQKVK
jgi:uncharacterized protein YraI